MPAPRPLRRATMRAENRSALESAQRHSAAAALRSAATSHNVGHGSAECHRIDRWDGRRYELRIVLLRTRRRCKHDATVTGGTLVDRLPLPTRCVEAMTGVGRQLIAGLRSDGTASKCRCWTQQPKHARPQIHFQSQISCLIILITSHPKTSQPHLLSFPPSRARDG